MPGAVTPILAAMVAIGAAAWILAIAAAVERRHAAMLAWCGVALATNLPTGFLTPLIVALLIGRRTPIRFWPIAPLSFLAATAALRLIGWPLPDLTTIHVGQAGWPSAPVSGAPNIWAIVQALPWIGDLPLGGLALATAIGAAAWFVARFAWRPPAGRDVTAAGLLIALLAAGILPGMTIQSFLMPDILALLLAVTRGDRRSWIICALVATGSALAQTGHLTGIGACTILGAVPMIVATAMMLRQFLVSPANDNGLPLNPFRAYPARGAA